MTLPSHLVKHPVRFPYDFSQRYSRPFAYYPGGGMRGGAGSGGDFWPPDDGLTPETIAHRDWAEQAAEEVAERIRQRALQRVKQVTYRERRQYALGEMEGGCDMCEGGARYGGSPTTIEGAPVLAGRGRMIGGVMRTQAGQQFLKSRLTARIRELNRIDALRSGTQLEPLPERDAVLTEDDAYVEQLGEYLDMISDAVATANFTKETVTAAQGLEKSLKTVGWRIPQNSITTMLRDVVEMMSELNRSYRIGISAAVSVSEFQLTAERRKNLRQTYLVLERARALLQYLTTKSDLSAEERKLALGAFKTPRRDIVERQRENLPRSTRGVRRENPVYRRRGEVERTAEDYDPDEEEDAFYYGSGRR